MKKLFSVILALCLLMTIAPAAVFAAEKTVVYCEAPEARGNVVIVQGASANIDWEEVRAAVKADVKAHQSEIDLTVFGITCSNDETSDPTPDFQTLKNILYYEPCLLRTVNGFSYTPDGGHVLNVYPNYMYSEEEYNSMLSECEDAILSIEYGVRDNNALSDAEKCLIIHDRLAAWAEYDYENLLEENVPEESYCPYGVLVLGTGVCDGYARTYDWILDDLGIENYYVDSVSLGHAWNIIVLDGEKYFADITNDDPVWDVSGRVYHNNFLISYSTFVSTHKPADDFDTSPSSTLYENMPWSGVSGECVLINGEIYYPEKSGTTVTVKKLTADGSETVFKKTNLKWPAPNSRFWEDVYTYITQIGDNIIYNTPTEIRQYNVASGEDSLVLAPDLSEYPEYTRIYGLTQKDGVIYYDLSASPNYDAQTKENTQSLEYCTEHENNITLYNRAASCTEQGEAKFICPDCRKITKKIISGEQHSLGEWIETLKPNCKDNGIKIRYCANCSYSETEDIEPLGHDYIDHEAKAATCTEAGWNAYQTCSRCNYTSYSSVPVLPHSFGEWQTTAEASCIQKGTKVRKCANCTYTETESFGPLSHQDSDRDGFCDTCGANIGTAQTKCSHICHKDGFMGFLWRIINMFNKLFRINQFCECGEAHW